MKLLLVTPPMTQLNTPYPATPYLTGFLRARGVAVAQADPGLLWVLRILSLSGLRSICDRLPAQPPSASVSHLARHREAIIRQCPVALALLQQRDTSMASRIAARRYLVEGPRFANIGPPGHEEDYLQWAFGSMGQIDKARYVATLFLEDIADAIRDGLDPHFGFARYGEALAASQPTFDPLLEALHAKPSPLTHMLDAVCAELLAAHQPTVVGMTLPFPGNLLGALRMAKTLKQHQPTLKIIWGGGFVNTELRDLQDPRVFADVDAMTYDDGEAPLLALLQYYAGKLPATKLIRTRQLCGDNVEYLSDPDAVDVPFKDTGTPTYVGLPLNDYLATFDVLNPMHRMWSEVRWNKLTMAHGCYWKKCSFCDISLSYIRDYSPLSASLLVDRMQALVDETGTRGFHFVDEAAPPAGLKAMSREILRRGLEVSWWANIRFDKAFTADLCRLMQEAGCIAVSGGLEVASNRLLKLMRKGVTVEQVALVTSTFNSCGILVHAYLMYGFPSQTKVETVDSLELVRQLFAEGCIDSAFWHRFSATAHSPVGLQPQAYGIRLLPTPPPTFARNDLPFVDERGDTPDHVGKGLRKAVYNYMLGMGVDEDVRVWFTEPMPKPTVRRNVVRQAIEVRLSDTARR